MRAIIVAAMVGLVSVNAMATMLPGQYDVLSPEQHKVLTLDVKSQSYTVQPDASRSVMMAAFPVEEQMQAIALTQCNYSPRSFGAAALCKVADPVTGSTHNDETALLSLKIESANTMFPRLSGQITLLTGMSAFSQSNFHIKTCSLRKV